MKALEYHAIIIIANSYKHNGRCVAGIDLSQDGFPLVRPVSSNDAGQLPVHDIAPEGLDSLPVFKTVLVPLTRSTPESYQSENWEVVEGASWIEANSPQIMHELILKVANRQANLWTKDDPKSEVGANYNSWNAQRDRLPFDEANQLQSSLALIKLDSMRIDRWKNLDTGEIEQFRGNFKYDNRYFNLKITDPKVEALWESLPTPKTRRPHEDSPHIEPRHVNNILTTISLGVPFHGYVYRLIANIQRFSIN